MLKLPSVPGDAKCNEIVTRFVSERLAGLMADHIWNAVSLDLLGEYGDAILEKETQESFSNIEEMVNFDALLGNRAFAEEVSLFFAPEGFDPIRANWNFLELYRLLKAKKEYVPELVMEYMLAQLIHREIWTVDTIREDTEDGLFDEAMRETMGFLFDDDDDDYDEEEDEDLDEDGFSFDDDEEYTTIERIPEPDRSYVLSVFREEAEEELTGEELLEEFEDLRKYDESCFWDFDYAMLDMIDEPTLRGSSMWEELGIGDDKELRYIDVKTSDGKGGMTEMRLEVPVLPWDQEEEE